jgi:hypothetical protein
MQKTKESVNQESQQSQQSTAYSSPSEHTQSSSEQATPPAIQITVSLLFVYYMVGMGIGTAISMLLLSFVKPWIPSDSLVYFLFLPLLLGSLIGFRMIYLANEQALTLGESIKACFKRS